MLHLLIEATSLIKKWLSLRNGGGTGGVKRRLNILFYGLTKQLKPALLESALCCGNKNGLFINKKLC
ncbi:MAG: hypothetical protein EA344_01695 [Alkalicoccus sp.]|nr:MAG: hypothetical protein EA344_01695 [Alkalicoccus sp.]